MRKIIGKKAELTTQQIVTLIILIISFVIILFLLVRLNLREETNKEICHNSVVLLERKAGVFASLDCKTNYACISMGKVCENFQYDYTSDVKNDIEIINVINNESADCWWMFGEGKIDYVGGADINSGYRCAICSTIEFDKNIQEKYSELDILDINGNAIDTAEQYSIITGIDIKLSTLEDKFIEPIIVKTDEINSMNPKCEEFINKV